MKSTRFCRRGLILLFLFKEKIAKQRHNNKDCRVCGDVKLILIWPSKEVEPSHFPSGTCPFALLLICIRLFMSTQLSQFKRNKSGVLVIGWTLGRIPGSEVVSFIKILKPKLLVMSCLCCQFMNVCKWVNIGKCCKALWAVGLPIMFLIKMDL